MKQLTDKQTVLLASFFLGAVTFMVQIVTIREFLALFEGNELIVAIFMASWMMLTGLGAAIPVSAKRNNFAKAIGLNLFWLMFLGLISLVLLYGIKILFIKPGEQLSLYSTAVITVLSVAPFCLMSGAFFRKLVAGIHQLSTQNKAGKIYAWESLGGLAGGLVLNAILIWLLNNLEVLAVVFMITSLGLFYIAFSQRHFVHLFLAFLLFLISLVPFLFPVEKELAARVYNLPTVDYYRDTPMGKLLVSQSENQLHIIENGVFLQSGESLEIVEEEIHLPLLQQGNPKSVLLISGGFTAVFKELNKYNLQSVSYVELNPWLLDLAQKYTTVPAGLNLIKHREDPRRFIQRSDSQFDVILLKIPLPVTAQFNRFYTLEFFAEIRRNMTEDAVLSLSVPISGNYLSDEQRELLSAIYNTLNELFDEVRLYPGNNTIVMASDKKLDIRVGKILKERAITTNYLGFYTDDGLIAQREDFLKDQILPSIPLNKDLFPVAYFKNIQLWLGVHQIALWIPVLLFAVVFIFLLLSSGSLGKGMMITGFSGASVEMLVLFLFQLIHGYIYQATGIFFMLFMAGLSTGAYLVPRWLQNPGFKSLASVQMGLGLFLAFLPLIFISLTKIAGWQFISYLIFAFIVFMPAFFVGTQYAQSVLVNRKLDFIRGASGLYALDLIGSAVGTVLISVYLLPLLGFIWLSLLLGILNLLMCILFFYGKRSLPAS